MLDRFFNWWNVLVIFELFFLFGDGLLLVVGLVLSLELDLVLLIGFWGGVKKGEIGVGELVVCVGEVREGGVGCFVWLLLLRVVLFGVVFDSWFLFLVDVVGFFFDDDLYFGMLCGWGDIVRRILGFVNERKS